MQQSMCCKELGPHVMLAARQTHVWHDEHALSSVSAAVKVLLNKRAWHEQASMQNFMMHLQRAVD